MLPLVALSLFLTLIATAYIYVNYIFTYWKRRGVPYAEPSFPFGNFNATFTKKKGFGHTLHELYHSTDAPFLGIYNAIRPALLIRDPRIIRDIFIKDFQYFWHRGFHYDENVDPLASNLFSQSGEKWRDMRTKLSPGFTSGKIKAMFQTIVDCGKSLETHLKQLASKQNEVEVRDIFARFTTNVIASVAFGLDVDCIANPDDEFKSYSGRFFEPKFKHVVRFNMSYLSPFLTKFLGIRFADKDIADFMRETIRQNLEYREKNNVIRKDFFQLLMQLRNTGKVQDDDENWETKSTNNTKSITIDDMMAQAYVFLIAGYESSSTTMSFCLYELAKNPNLQQKVYDEITDVLKNHDGKLTYDSLSEMKYLDKCIDETLRIHPPFDFTTRECTKDYKIADSDVVIKKGTSILVSITGIQYDGRFWDEPETFNPDRFNDEYNKNSIETPYLVFGDGQRNCIGMRLGKIQAKTGVCLLLQKFSFELGEQHVNKKLVLDPLSGVRAPISGIKLKVKVR